MRIPDQRFRLSALLFLALAGCGSIDQEGMVLLTDDSYNATIVGMDGDGFTVPDGLLWRDGILYMADEGGSALRAWAGKGNSTTLLDANAGLQAPEDLAMDAEGNIFLTDDDAGGVWQVSKDGKASLLAGKDKGLVSTEGIALSPSGTILVGETSERRILEVARDGKVSTFLGPEHGIRKPESMVYDDEGNLYIADNQDNILYLLTPAGKLHRPIANQPDFSPESITFADGILYITDSDNGKLFRYTPEDGLDTIAVFGGKLANAAGVTVDDRGSIYVSVQSDLKGKRGYVVRLDPGNSRR